MLNRFLSLITASYLLSQAATAQDQVSTVENTTNKTGYFNTTELTFSKGFLKENTSFYTGLQTINGYRFNNHISAGIGLGVEQYFYENFNDNGYKAGETYLPVFTDFRLYLGKGKTQPFFSQAVGYAFCIRQLEEFRGSDYFQNIGGTFINPSIGITTHLSDKTSLNFSLGYRFQEVTINDLPIYLGDSDQLIVIQKSINASSHYLTFKTGVTF